MSANGYHVTLADGKVMGVAADRQIDARQIAHARMIDDGADQPIERIESIGRVDWDYGTTIRY